jgi:hypothetical protein
MSIQTFIVILALISMLIAVSPPQPAPRPAPARQPWPINWMCLSFFFLILAWLVGTDAFHFIHR